MDPLKNSAYVYTDMNVIRRQCSNEAAKIDKYVVHHKTSTNSGMLKKIEYKITEFFAWFVGKSDQQLAKKLIQNAISKINATPANEVKVTEGRITKIAEGALNIQTSADVLLKNWMPLEKEVIENRTRTEKLEFLVEGEEDNFPKEQPSMRDIKAKREGFNWDPGAEELPPPPPEMLEVINQIVKLRHSSPGEVDKMQGMSLIQLKEILASAQNFADLTAGEEDNFPKELLATQDLSAKALEINEKEKLMRQLKELREFRPGERAQMQKMTKEELEKYIEVEKEQVEFSPNLSRQIASVAPAPLVVSAAEKQKEKLRDEIIKLAPHESKETLQNLTNEELLTRLTNLQTDDLIAFTNQLESQKKEQVIAEKNAAASNPIVMAANLSRAVPSEIMRDAVTHDAKEWDALELANKKLVELEKASDAAAKSGSSSPNIVKAPATDEPPKT